MTTTTNTPSIPQPTTPRAAARPDAGPDETILLYCDAHFDAFKRDHTLNAVHASRRMFDALLHDEPFQTSCGRDDKAGKPADAARMYVEGARLGPVCCYLPHEVRDGILTECKALRERAMEAITRTELARQPLGGHRSSRPGGA